MATLRLSRFNAMTLLKAFNYVDPKDGSMVRTEVRRDPTSGLTLKRTVKSSPNVNLKGDHNGQP